MKMIVKFVLRELDPTEKLHNHFCMTELLHNDGCFYKS